MDKTSVDTFIQFEDEHNLFERHIDDFYYWHYIRYDIFKNVFWREALSNVKKGDAPKFKDLMTMLYCAIFRNTWFVHKHVDILAIGYPRKIRNSDGKREDPYIEPIVRNTSHSALTLEVYSRQSNNIDSDPHQVKFIEDARLRGKIINKFLSAKEKLELGEAAEYIFKLFSVFDSSMNKKAVLHSIQSAYSSRKAFVHKFRRLLKETSPCCIMATPGYAVHAMALFELASEFHIPTVEIEHGFILETAAPYNFASKRNIKSFPKHIFTYSQYQIDNVRFPIKTDRIKTVGWPYLENKVNNRSQKIEQRNILLLGDMTCGDILAAFAIDLIEYIKKKGLPKCHIVFKAHPFDSCKGENWDKLKEKNYDDIELITGGSGKSVYDCLERAEIVIGIQTSSLFEAQMYGCSVYVLRSNCNKAFDKFIDQGYFYPLEKPEDIFKHHGFAKPKQLWALDAMKNTLHEIDNIIESQKSKGDKHEK